MGMELDPDYLRRGIRVRFDFYHYPGGVPAVRLRLRLPCPPTARRADRAEPSGFHVAAAPRGGREVRERENRAPTVRERPNTPSTRRGNDIFSPNSGKGTSHYVTIEQSNDARIVR